MRHQVLLSLFLALLTFSTYAQHDTLITRQSEKIPCKITEIGEDEVKYKKANNPDGPVYSSHKNKLREIIFANGTRELISQDALSLDARSTPELLNETKSIKIEPFSPFLNHVCLGYEQMLKVGTNLEVKVGFINGSLNPNNRGASAVMGSDILTGGFVKGGVKFLLGQDFVMRGVRFAHPLKGRYVRFDADLVYLNFQNAKGRYYYYNNASAITSDVLAYGYGLFINYGRQFVLGDILTLDYYVGLGASGRSVSYSNPNFNKPPAGYPYPNNYNYDDLITNYYSHYRSQSAFSATFGLSVGYIVKGKGTIKK